MNDTPTLTTYTGARAWDNIWKWVWFARDQWLGTFRSHKEGSRRSLSSLLGKLKVKTVLDCSCGLGFKTIMMTEMGYSVTGCDRSATAVKHAAQLAAGEGLDIEFFKASWDSLGETARRYDCVYCDAFTWIPTRGAMLRAAKGIVAALKPGGVLIFMGPHEWPDGSNNRRLTDEQFKHQGAFEALPVCERNGVSLTTMIAREKTPDGILGSRIHIVDDHGKTRIEVARALDVIKWTWQNCHDVTLEAGFRKFYSVKERTIGSERCILNVAVK